MAKTGYYPTIYKDCFLSLTGNRYGFQNLVITTRFYHTSVISIYIIYVAFLLLTSSRCYY